ncbi:MAG: hypothetical protein ACREJB_12585 [Planctomycetaceae bacterium]
MSKLRLMSGHGDQCLAEWEPEQPELLRQAADLFQAQRARGCLAFRIDGPGRNEPIRDFDPAAREILLMPPVQGG